MLLCDIGNTTFSFYNTKTKQNFKIFLDQNSFPKAKKIYFISVNKKGTKKLKKRYKKVVNLKKYIHLNSSYKGLGIDRAIACYGIKNGIIIDAGSAITVDIVKDNIHMGGFIMPGINSFFKIYPKISKKLKFKLDLNTDSLPQNTNQAINYSILKMIILPIKEIILENRNLKIYITGGDGEILQNLLNKYFIKTYYNPNLIFDSMYKVVKDNNL